MPKQLLITAEYVSQYIAEMNQHPHYEVGEVFTVLDIIPNGHVGYTSVKVEVGNVWQLIIIPTALLDSMIIESE
jgi:hypothetical protein